jgi:hypothetical protein
MSMSLNTRKYELEHCGQLQTSVVQTTSKRGVSGSTTMPELGSNSPEVNASANCYVISGHQSPEYRVVSRVAVVELITSAQL